MSEATPLPRQRREDNYRKQTGSVLRRKTFESGATWVSRRGLTDRQRRRANKKAHRAHALGRSDLARAETFVSGFRNGSKVVPS